MVAFPARRGREGAEIDVAAAEQAVEGVGRHGRGRDGGRGGLPGQQILKHREQRLLAVGGIEIAPALAGDLLEVRLGPGVGEREGDGMGLDGLPVGNGRGLVVLGHKRRELGRAFLIPAALARAAGPRAHDRLHIVQHGGGLVVGPGPVRGAAAEQGVRRAALGGQAVGQQDLEVALAFERRAERAEIVQRTAGLDLLCLAGRRARVQGRVTIGGVMDAVFISRRRARDIGVGIAAIGLGLAVTAGVADRGHLPVTVQLPIGPGPVAGERGRIGVKLQPDIGIAPFAMRDGPAPPVARGLGQGLLDRGGAQRLELVHELFQPLAHGLELFLFCFAGHGILDHEPRGLGPARVAAAPPVTGRDGSIKATATAAASSIDPEGQGVAGAPAGMFHLRLHQRLDVGGLVPRIFGPAGHTPVHRLGQITPPGDTAAGRGIACGIAAVFPPNREARADSLPGRGVKLHIGARDGRVLRHRHAGEAQPDPVSAEIKHFVIEVAPAAARTPFLGVISAGRNALAHRTPDRAARAEGVAVLKAHGALGGALVAEELALVVQVALVRIAADQKGQRVAAEPGGLVRDFLDDRFQVRAFDGLVLLPVRQCPARARAGLRAPGEVPGRCRGRGGVARLFGLDRPAHGLLFIGRRGEDEVGALHGRPARDADPFKAERDQRLFALRFEFLIGHGELWRHPARLVVALYHALADETPRPLFSQAKAELVPLKDTALGAERRGRGLVRGRCRAVLADHVLHQCFELRGLEVIDALCCHGRQVVPGNYFARLGGPGRLPAAIDIKLVLAEVLLHPVEEHIALHRRENGIGIPDIVMDRGRDGVGIGGVIEFKFQKGLLNQGVGRDAERPARGFALVFIIELQADIEARGQIKRRAVERHAAAGGVLVGVFVGIVHKIGLGLSLKGPGGLPYRVHILDPLLGEAHGIRPGTRPLLARVIFAFGDEGGVGFVLARDLAHIGVDTRDGEQHGAAVIGAKAHEAHVDIAGVLQQHLHRALERGDTALAARPAHGFQHAGGGIQDKQHIGAVILVGLGRIKINLRIIPRRRPGLPRQHQQTPGQNTRQPARNGMFHSRFLNGWVHGLSLCSAQVHGLSRCDAWIHGLSRCLSALFVLMRECVVCLDV